MTDIPHSEFSERIQRIQDAFEAEQLDGLMVYGDEYRRENLRDVSNFWQIFERAACLIPRQGDPILVGAPEGEQYAREMCPWSDLRNIKEFACVSVPEEIDYPLAVFSSLTESLNDTLQGGRRLGLVGRWDMPGPIYERVSTLLPGLEVIEADSLLHDARLIKKADVIS